MKKVVSLILIILMVTSLITGCGKDEKPTSEELSGGDVTLLEESTLNFDEDKDSEEMTQEIGQDFNTDVEAGLLWIDDQGRVTDKDGNVIEAYNYITANDRKTLIAANSIMTGYTMTDDMQIIIDQEYLDLVQNDELTISSYADTLLSIADSSVKGQKATLTEPNNLPEDSADIADNRNTYYSDIIYGNWWTDRVNGTPITYSPDVYVTFLPDKITSSVHNADIEAFTQLHMFKFIDQNTYTTEELKRSTPDNHLYGFYLQNVQKKQNEGGVYFTGYIDTEFVAVYGNYSNLMNGDNVFVYAAYNGLSLDDVMVFDAGYLEFVN